MGRARRSCGCALAVLCLCLAGVAYVGYKFIYPWWKTKPPPASGGELQIHVLDIGPVNGDSIIIISPAKRTVLIDAGDTGKGKIVVEALKRYGVQQLDYLIATHPHPDHIGGASEVIKAIKVVNVIDNGRGPSLPPDLQPTPVSPIQSARTKPQPPPQKRVKTHSITKYYDDYRQAIANSGAHYSQATVNAKLDLGGGTLLTILAPTEPFFTKEQMKTGGNEPNANSVVLRLDYGDFSMLLPGDAEEQTEHRMVSKDVNLSANVLKIAHHGSKYATSQDFLNRVKPQVAVISCGEWNRYGHPSQVVLDRLRAANVKLYRTDMHGEITITTRGRNNDYTVKTVKTPAEDLWMGRIAQKDDSSRSGFIAYGDFGPPPKPRPEKSPHR